MKKALRLFRIEIRFGEPLLAYFKVGRKKSVKEGRFYLISEEAGMKKKNF